jgi:hypothetical protein
VGAPELSFGAGIARLMPVGEYAQIDGSGGGA